MGKPDSNVIESNDVLSDAATNSSDTVSTLGRTSDKGRSAAPYSRGSPEVTQETVHETINIDNALEEVVVPNGFWQWYVSLLLMFSSTSIATFPVFANSASDHRCRMEPELEVFIARNNFSFDYVASVIGPWFQTKDASYPSTPESYGCARYQINWTSFAPEELFNTAAPINVSHARLESCPFGFVHKPSSVHYPNSVVVEFGTVCEKMWLVPTGTTIFIFGMVVGMILGGWLGDSIGRKKTIICCSFLEFFAGVCTSVAPNYSSYVLFRAVMGIGNLGKTVTVCVLVVEITTARYRSTFLALISVGTHFIYRALLSLWAYFIPYWRWLNAVMLCPLLLSFLYFHFIPESPRWLASQNRLNEAVSVLKTGCRMNHLRKSKGPHMEWFDQVSLCQSRSETPLATPCRTKPLRRCMNSLLKPFSTKKLAKNMLFSFLLFAGVFTSFFGMLLYARNVWNYIYLVAFLNSAASLPAVALFLLLYRYIRRRKCPLFVLVALITVLLAGCGLYVILVKPQTDTVLTVCSNIALGLLTTSISMCFIYLPELFPSHVRTHGFGLSTGLGRICGMSCTFINELDKFVMHGLPLLVFSGLTTISLIAMLVMPETSGVNLPDIDSSSCNDENAVQGPVDPEANV